VVWGDPELSTSLTQIELTAEDVRGNHRKRMVGRDGIEPPTPGFSGQEHDSRELGTLGHKHGLDSPTGFNGTTSYLEVDFAGIGLAA
jgi:hypothetical protein